MRLPNNGPLMRGFLKASLSLAFPLLLAGCSFQPAPLVSLMPASQPGLHGHIKGGQQPVVGASILLYGVGTGGDKTAATPLLTQPVTTDLNGFFDTTAYSCTGVTDLYIVSNGGNPGLSANNPNLSMMAALGDCAAAGANFVDMDEVTTVAAVAALAPFMASSSTVASGTADASALASAFALSSQFVSTSSGTAPGLGAPSGYTVPTTTINTLADILSSCINSTGGTASDTSTPCGLLFSLTTVGGVVPTDTVAALINLANNPTLNTGALFNQTPPAPPFLPTLMSAPPDFRIRLTAPASSMALQISPSSLAFPTTSVGYGSPTQAVTLTNTSNTSVALGSFAITGTNAADFVLQSGCPASLQATASCTVQLALTPAATGTRAAYLGIASSTPDSPQYVSLTGTGDSSGSGGTLSLSASALTFSSAAEKSAAAQTVTLSNTGNAPLTVNTLTLGGANATVYSETDTCAGQTLAPAATCTASLTFKPFLATTQTATLSIASSAGLPQAIALNGTGTGSVSLSTSNSTKWVITNGTITYEFNPTSGHITAVYYNNSSANSLLDTTNQSGGYPSGLYMDDTGLNYGSGTVTSGYTYGPNKAFVDFWSQSASNSSNAFTIAQHIVVSANDNGFHAYNTIAHSANDIPGNIGQWQYVFRIDLNKFTKTYSVDAGLGNLGVMDIPLPSPSVTGNTDPGRKAQDATLDLHGLSVPAGFTRSFYTKYDYSSYEYLHKIHGVYGSTYAAWTILPSTESMSGGPTKQDLIFTDNILIMEMQSGHFNSNLVYTPPQGVATTRLFGPFYFHFNTFDATHTTSASLAAEAQSNVPSFNQLYDADPLLTGAGYATSGNRGSVAPVIAGSSATPYTAWTVLSDNALNHQLTNTGNQYWTANNATGDALLTNVKPGNYRLSHYVLGQWGELRVDNVQVTANTTTTAPNLTFTPENFGTNPPIFTIGTPDRSAHEFLHGHDSNGNDVRNYYGTYNYWADFASTSGQQIYYATASGGTPATNDLNKLNYVQWQIFNPGLFGGVYNAADDTTDGYKYIVPAYVSAPATQQIPQTTLHFTLTPAQQAQGQYVVLSTAFAASNASYTAYLNGHILVWHGINGNDAMVRSGLSGYTQWIAYQWDAKYLNAAGTDNVLTFAPSQSQGVMVDAFRLEVTNMSADPNLTGWHDYEYLYNNTYIPANNALPNN